MVQEDIKIDSKPFKLSSLRKHFERRIFAVPELQREFVWDERKACKLLDSIYHNYPVGGVLVWKTNYKNENLLRSRLHILPQFNPANKEIWFLIDGQQRLSVLWQVLRGEGNEVTNERGNAIDFGRIWFNAGKANNESLFVYRKHQPSNDHVAVVHMLATNWNERLRDLPRRVYDRVKDGHDRLMSYQILVTFLESRSLEAVRETFIRINSLGTPIRAADRAFARASSIKLRHLVRGLQSELGHGFNAISEESVLLAAALVRGETDIGARAVDSMIRRVEDDDEQTRAFRRMWPKLKTSIGLAVDYLVSNYGVGDHGFLPSDYIVVVLAQFFFFNENRRPARKVKDVIRRWFWATAVATRYTGRGFRPNILADANLMRRLAETGRGRFAVAQLTPMHVLKHADYSRRGMLTDGYFCLLRLKKPRYLEDGEEVPEGDYSTRANRNDKHHIFPKQKLKDRGYSAKDYNCIPNICFLVARENQSIGAKVPDKYMNELAETKILLHKALRSHLIPYDDDCGLWDSNMKRGYRKFVERRAEIIAKAFEDEAGMKLFLR